MRTHFGFRISDFGLRRPRAFSRERERARWALLPLLAVSLALLAGCQPKPLPPAMPLQQLVEAVNANNARLPWFKARMSTIDAKLVDENGAVHRFGMYGFLIYAQPDHVYMDASVGVNSVFGLGSNPENYWAWIRPSAGKCWFGSYGRWDPVNPPRGVPIQPRQFAQLLGVDAIPTDLSVRPWPVARMSEPADRSGIIQFIQPSGDHLVLVRELWIDRDTSRPTRVRLFDKLGQAAIESTLSNWKPVKGADACFPHDVTFQWIVRTPRKGGFIEENGSRLRLFFSEVEVNEKFSPAKAARIYEFRPPEDLELVPLDEPAGPEFPSTTTMGDDA